MKVIEGKTKNLKKNSCDHKWGDGEDEYSKLRTVYSDNRYLVQICDRCKMLLVNGEEYNCFFEDPKRVKG